MILIQLRVLGKREIQELVDNAGSVYRLAKDTGLQQSSIHRYLKGNVEPSLSSLVKLNQYAVRTKDQTSSDSFEIEEVEIEETIYANAS